MKYLAFILLILSGSLRAATLNHGPIVGRPQADSMRVWVRTSEPCTFRIDYDRKPEITSAYNGTNTFCSARVPLAADKH